MHTPDDVPTGPRGPRTTAPGGEPLKQQEPQTREKEASGTDVEERHQKSPPPPHGDPLRREIAR